MARKTLWGGSLAKRLLSLSLALALALVAALTVAPKVARADDAPLYDVTFSTMLQDNLQSYTYERQPIGDDGWKVNVKDLMTKLGFDTYDILWVLDDSETGIIRPSTTSMVVRGYIFGDSRYKKTLDVSVVTSGGFGITSPKWRRLAGSDRYATMAAISSTGFTKSSWAVVATGNNYPDALAACSLAGAKGCPVLLSAKDELSAEAATELTRLGVTNVYLMGGDAVLSPAVESAIAEKNIKVTRVEGTDRYATSAAALVATRAAASTSNTVIVTTGSNFADALSVAPWAYATKSPIVLAGPDGSLPQSVVNAVLADKGLTRVLVVGGTKVVSDAVRDQLAGLEFERAAGDDRYATSAKVATIMSGRGLGWTDAFVTTGRGFSDALAGAALAGSRGGVLLLANSPTDVTVTLENENSAQVSNGLVLGGPNAVSDDVLSALR